MFWKLEFKIDKFIKLSNCRTVFDYDMVIRVSFVYTIFQAVVLITRLDFLHVQILKARRTWSMTSFGIKTQREGAQEMKMIE